MDLLKHFLAYVADFERTYVDDDWSRLEPYFARDAEYRVDNTAFACQVHGRDAILRAMRKSVDGFDRHCERKVTPSGPPDVQGDRITVSWSATYTHAGSPPLDIQATSTVEYAGGVIKRLVDGYHDGVDERYQAWRDAHGAGLDPSYV